MQLPSNPIKVTIQDLVSQLDKGTELVVFVRGRKGIRVNLVSVIADGMIVTKHSGSTSPLIIMFQAIDVLEPIHVE